MKRIIIIVAIALGTLSLGSCTDAYKSSWGGLNNEHKVELYSGGKIVKTWTSTGKVNATEHSDGYYFRDKKCQCNVEISGDIVITRIVK